MIKQIHKSTNYGCLDIRTVRNVLSSLFYSSHILFTIHAIYYEGELAFSKIKHLIRSCLTMKCLRKSCMADLQYRSLSLRHLIENQNQKHKTQQHQFPIMPQKISLLLNSLILDKNSFWNFKSIRGISTYVYKNEHSKQ